MSAAAPPIIKMDTTIIIAPEETQCKILVSACISTLAVKCSHFTYIVKCVE